MENQAPINNFYLSFKLRRSYFDICITPERSLCSWVELLSIIGHAWLNLEAWAAFFQITEHSTHFSENHTHKLRSALWKHLCLAFSQALFTCSSKQATAKNSQTTNKSQGGGPRRLRILPTFPYFQIWGFCVQSMNSLKCAAPVGTPF